MKLFVQHIVYGIRTLDLALQHHPASLQSLTSPSHLCLTCFFFLKAVLLSIICLKLHLEFFLRFRALRVLIILICLIKQLVVCG